MANFFNNTSLVLVLSFLIILLISHLSSILARALVNKWFKQRSPNNPNKMRRAWKLTVFLTGLLFTSFLYSVSSLPIKFLITEKLPHELMVFSRIFLIIGTIIFLDQLVYLATTTIRKRYSLEVENNLHNRRFLTKYTFIQRLLRGAIIVLGTGVILLQFDAFTQFGKGILASAGVLSIVLGIAAQRTLGNLMAGIQVAFTQPIRLDDAVFVEGEWGWIEEITFTYVVIKIWDLRRLVVPINYFVENPIQNWTRSNSQIIGNVMFYLDYKTPVELIRQKFNEAVESSKLWDGEVKVLQVIETSDRVMVLRGLMTAKDSPTVWDLRCEVREKILNFIQTNIPEAIPQYHLSQAEKNPSEKK